MLGDVSTSSLCEIMLARDSGRGPTDLTGEREVSMSDATDRPSSGSGPETAVSAPYAEARDDYAIFADLAERLGAREAFTEGRSIRQWLEYLYEPTRAGLAKMGLPLSSFAEFWAGNGLELPQEPDDGGLLRAFAADPVGAPLRTPSGRIEIFSSTIASFEEPDCPGHPAWLPPADVPSANAPLMLIANQPTTRLHSQLDFGGYSSEAKHRGREVARMHPDDAAARGISDGDIIRLFNARGACLASVRVTDGIRRGGRSASHRRLVRPRGSGGGHAPLRAWQPECAHPRRRDLCARSGLHWPAYDSPGPTLYRQPAADSGLRWPGGISTERARR